MLALKIRPKLCVVNLISFLTSLMCCLNTRADVIWIEGESFTHAQVQRHPWWYDKVKKNELSGDDLISNWSDKPGTVEYSFQAPAAGEYDFWVRANPVSTRMSYQLNQAAAVEIDLAKEPVDSRNIAEDGKPDLRFIAWEHVGAVKLAAGSNTLKFGMHSDNHNHGMLDCFVLSTVPFVPNGIVRPGGPAGEMSTDQGWFPFVPTMDSFSSSAGFDLRTLNETRAGDQGFVQVRSGEFVHGGTGHLIRFWGVNGPPDSIVEQSDLEYCGRLLARYGVNLVRLHAPIYEKDGTVSPSKIQHAIAAVEAMQDSGIYSDFSIYWFNFLTPPPETPWLKGYDGKRAPVAALMIDPDFQAVYQQWWRALLTTPSSRTGKRLIDNPACACLEIQNEDSLLFWTFSDSQIPDPVMEIIERQFGDWLKTRYGSIETAIARWRAHLLPRDHPEQGRIAFRPMWNIFNERTLRDQDTAAFLTEFQRRFYQKQIDYIRSLGFRGVVATSGWTTASPTYLGPLDKYTDTVGDYIDRHGYFAGNRHGENEGWALMNGQIYNNRSALRFDPAQPGKPRDVNNPVIDPHYGGLPSMISETAFERPNRFRSEAPLYYACYGSLQGSNGITFFALDSDRWSTKPGYFMQPWTLMAPAVMGQFPAAALIYRAGLVSTGKEMVSLTLNIKEIESLSGTPMPQDASFDELRSKDVPDRAQTDAAALIDPLVHFTGRTSVMFSNGPGRCIQQPLSGLVNHPARTVISANGQLKLDYDKGALVINAPMAQGISGNLSSLGAVSTADIDFRSDMEVGHIIAVALDGKPLAASSRILLQVMSEEQATGFRTEDAGHGNRRILEIGRDPWLVRELRGKVSLKRPDAAKLKVHYLDANGYPTGLVRTADRLLLDAKTTYYLITP